MRALIGMMMRVALTTAAIAAAASAEAATIAGTVAGPDGKPFRGAFVQARNLATKITVSVLSDNAGKYRIENLGPGEYRLSLRAIGYKADPVSGITLAPEENLARDLTLAQSLVRWSDISMHLGRRLLPDYPGKDELFTHCMACHGFQSRMAAVIRDADGWRDRVNYMRDAMGFFVGDPRFGFTDEKAEKVIGYLTAMFGEESKLVVSPADLSQYRDALRPLADEALNIVYVEYDTPGPNRMPWSAHPDKDGTFWVPYYGAANRIGHLDPKTGAIAEYPVPNIGTAAIHSAVPAPDGSVWLTEQGSNKLGRFDPVTRTITEYQDNARKHTVRVDPKTGLVWSTGALTRFDPKTERFTPIAEVPTSYGIALDRDGNAWFTELTANGKVGKVDATTLAVTKYTLPTVNGRPRRIQVDETGIVWFGEFDSGRIGRLDPKSGAITEFQLPGPQPTPYALGIDRGGMVWYSSEYMDVVGRLDPTTGKVVEYPFPHAENSLRDFFLDDAGRMWFGSPANDKIGYFYLAHK
jgi:virginiamycin B lyase